MPPGKPSDHVYVIAEAGVNHNGSPDLAKRLIEIAAEAGADAVKFQTFKAESLVTKRAATAAYQQAATGGNTQFEMLKKLELPQRLHYELLEHAESFQIQFLSTGFDEASLLFLHQLGISPFKIPSGEITNYPLLKTVAGFGKPTILSTGMASISEVEDCLDVLTSGGLTINQITILHCNTQYPTPMTDVNLLAMQTIGRKFPGVRVGYSDHTVGIEIPIAAVALGAKVIEKHVTLDKQMEGPDHAASLDPEEFKAMVTAIRNIESALGDGVKRPSPSELPNRSIVRKSLVAACPIKQGELLTKKNLTAKRPGDGRSPMHWPNLIGTRANRDYEPDEKID